MAVRQRKTRMISFYYECKNAKRKRKVLIDLLEDRLYDGFCDHTIKGEHEKQELEEYLNILYKCNGVISRSAKLFFESWHEKKGKYPRIYDKNYATFIYEYFTFIDDYKISVYEK